MAASRSRAAVVARRLEGKARARNVVLEFESYDAARRYIHSEQYQAARALREGAADMEMVLVEGV